MEVITRTLIDGKIVAEKKSSYVPYEELTEEIKKEAHRKWSLNADMTNDLKGMMDLYLSTDLQKFANSVGLAIEDVTWSYEDGCTIDVAVTVFDIDDKYFVDCVPEKMRKRAEFMVLHGGVKHCIAPDKRDSKCQDFSINFCDPFGLYDHADFKEVGDVITKAIWESVENVRDWIRCRIESEDAYLHSEECFLDIAEENEWLFNTETGEVFEEKYI